MTPELTLYANSRWRAAYDGFARERMGQLLREARHWGYTVYADGIDAEDRAYPVDPQREGNPGPWWERLKGRFLAAKDAGLESALAVSPNQLFSNQLKPEWDAVRCGRIQGPVVCTAQPGARDGILAAYEALFQDLARAGIALGRLLASPYDPGGCLCDACRPWLRTALALIKEIHGIAAKHHPGVTVHFLGRLWQAPEYRLFTEWMEKNAPGWAKSLAIDVPFLGAPAWGAPCPAGCARYALVHLEYAESTSPRDAHGLLGPVAAPRRLAATAQPLAAKAIAGVVAHSEGLFDHVNQALLPALVHNASSDAVEAIAAYAVYNHCAREDEVGPWAARVAQLGDAFQGKPAGRPEPRETAPYDGPGPWSARQWRRKEDLLRHHTAIVAQSEWTPSRRAHAAAFLEIQRTLQEDLWQCAASRGPLSPANTPLPWISHYCRLGETDAQA